MPVGGWANPPARCPALPQAARSNCNMHEVAPTRALARGSVGSAAKEGACRGSGMDAQLCQYTLGVVPCGVRADPQRRGDRDIGSSARQEHRDLELSGSEAVGGLEGGAPRRALEAGRAGRGGALFQQPGAELPHFVERIADLPDDLLSVLPQRPDRGAQRRQLVPGDGTRRILRLVQRLESLGGHFDLAAAAMYRNRSDGDV